MKQHTKRKAYRLALKQLTHDGYMNDPSGKMTKRSGLPDTSMKRDYHPQVGGHKK